MDIQDVFPPSGHVQHIYCSTCKSHMDLSFEDFHENVSGVDIAITELPYLKCPSCEARYLPDGSRFAIIELHRQAFEQNKDVARVVRNKRDEIFGFTKLPFQYDADDYYYIPGLYRSFNKGFLTPVFFNKEVLIKYDIHPSYRVIFASRTYGQICQGEDFSISFGINKHGRLVMWLGDIATLPEKEQYYLLSENISSDHSIGSEFYDGQIECIFTNQPPEDLLFKERSRFLEACFKRFGRKIAHLEPEVLDLSLSIRRPVVDTPGERRNIADNLNKIYLESLDNVALGSLLSEKGKAPDNMRSLKRIQKLMEITLPETPVAAIMNPLYVLYDLRVAYSHLGSEQGQRQKLGTVRQRLALDPDADIFVIYDKLIVDLQRSFSQFADALISPEDEPGS